MIGKKEHKIRFLGLILGCFFAVIGILGGFLSASLVYAEDSPNQIRTEEIEMQPEEGEDSPFQIETEEFEMQPEEGEGGNLLDHVGASVIDSEVETDRKISHFAEIWEAAGAENDCEETLGKIGWTVCPKTGKIAEAVDWLYERIDGVLKIDPVSMEDDSPVYTVWKYALNVANVLFIGFLLVVIYSQITGLGISNYGIKKAMPKLIVAAIVINLSFFLSSLLVDLSNVIGDNVRDLFASIGDSITPTYVVPEVDPESDYFTTEELRQMARDDRDALAGVALGLGAGVVAFESGAIWMLLPVLFGAIVSVVTGLITIALRQAVVTLLIMIAPLAIVASILPNTEKWYKKWLDLLKRMLVFYPLYSMLFGASNLAGYAILTSAKDGFGVLLGMAVQVFPLFYSWKLMKMSGTVLGTINSKLNGWMAKPLSTSRAWATQRRQSTKANLLANGVTPSARLLQFMDKRRALREENTKNALEIISSRNTLYVQKKIANSEISETTSRSRYTSRYTRNAKKARSYSLMASNAVANTEHVLSRYGQYFRKDAENNALVEQAKRAWLDHGRSIIQKEIDDEDDIGFLTEKFLDANKRDANNNPIDSVAFNRYVRSVVGPDGEERLLGKVIAQSAKVESKQRAEYHIMMNKLGLNGYNKSAFRSWLAGYERNDDGWAVGADGKRLKNDDGSYVEMIQGDVLTKAPEKMVLYDKRDEQGLYFDLKDQDGKIMARVHRGRGSDGRRHDDAAFIKEVISNFDIPISDPLNNVYGILSGIKPGDITTPQGQNEIGLARYSTTIGRAMSAYKGDASWAGGMFNSGIGNRQIKNSAQYAIWVLDSIKKTLKPGAFNTQNPASVEFVRTILDPDNWEKIFTEQEMIDAVNINNEFLGGEEWELDENGEIIGYTPVDNPTYEQRMNLLKRKLFFPAMSKILPAFDRLRTNNTIDNQKPGTADEQFKFLKMVQEKWENNPALNFDPTLVDQDLQSEARAFRQRKHDKDGNLLYVKQQDDTTSPSSENLLITLEEIYDNSLTAEELKDKIFAVLGSDDTLDKYSRVLERFNELCEENPNATMEEINGWFDDLSMLVAD